MWRTSPWLGRCGLFLFLVAPLAGCSSMGSIVTAFSGIPAVPANRLPPELFGRPKAELQELSLTRLRQNPPEVYQLGPGDVLGVYIETVLGNPEEAPPVHFPEDGSQPPAIGFPIPIREDGTVALPLILPVKISGLTLTQATASIAKAYTVDRKILPEGKDRIIVTLMRRREYRVLVVREEEGTGLGVTKRGTGKTVDLPAYENDLLHALNETGGLPGVDAKDEILIYRGRFKDAVERDRLVAEINAGRNPCCGPPPLPNDPNVVTVPLRFFPEQLPNLAEQDVILQTGDVVVIESRDREKYYTGGVLGSGEYLLPRDYDLDIMQAIAKAGGSLSSGGTGIGRGSGGGGGFGGSGGGGGGGGRGGSVGIAPSQAIVLRKLPEGGQVSIRVDLNRALTDSSQRILIQPEDVIILRYTLPEEIVNATMSLFQVNYLLGSGLNR